MKLRVNQYLLPLLIFATQAYSEPAAAPSTPPAEAVSFLRAQPAYVVTTLSGSRERRYVEELVRYITAVTGQPTVVVGSIDKVPAEKSAIILQRSNSRASEEQTPPVPMRGDEDFEVVARKIDRRSVLVVSAPQEDGIRRAVQRLVITSLQEPSALVFAIKPGTYSPWIAAREFEPVTWSPTFVRGIFTNPAVDRRVDYQHYSDRQLDRYMAMYDWFGYSGIRIEDGAWQWAIFGSIDAAHSFVRRAASHAAANSLKRTLHVLYADFSDFGWIDPTIVYEPREGMTAVTDPYVRATFEKYYERYAELAPYIDRMGGHMFDPGHLRNASDVIFYAQLLISKMRARHPGLPVDVVLWDASPQMTDQILSSALPVDILLSNLPSAWKTDVQRNRHDLVKKAGRGLGYWSWYISDMEPDEDASMYVNAQLLKSEFDRVRRDVDNVYHADYWSEMEGYHVLDMFSMYVSSQLQWAPERDPHDILLELCVGIWGPVNGQKLFDVLRLVEDVRTGPSWDTYWRNPSDVKAPVAALGTQDPARDLSRAELAMASLSGLRPDPGFVPKFPLPFEPEEITEMMLPHLKQIAAYSRFRVDLGQLKQRAAAGASKQELSDALQSIWLPVQEYNTWIGLPGPIELEAQIRELSAFENAYGIAVSDPEQLTAQGAERLVESFRERQRYAAIPVTWPVHLDQPLTGCYTDSFIRDNFLVLHRSWPETLAFLLNHKEIEQVETPRGARVRLSNWKEFAAKDLASSPVKTMDLCSVPEP